MLCCDAGRAELDGRYQEALLKLPAVELLPCWRGDPAAHFVRRWYGQNQGWQGGLGQDCHCALPLQVDPSRACQLLDGVVGKLAFTFVSSNGFSYQPHVLLGHMQGSGSAGPCCRSQTFVSRTLSGASSGSD